MFQFCPQSSLHFVFFSFAHVWSIFALRVPIFEQVRNLFLTRSVKTTGESPCDHIMTFSQRIPRTRTVLHIFWRVYAKSTYFQKKKFCTAFFLLLKVLRGWKVKSRTSN